MQETVQTIVNYALALLGFLAVIGVFVGIPAGIVMLATSGSQKDPKIKVRRIIWGIVLIAIPPFLIITVLISFAIVGTIFASPYGG